MDAREEKPAPLDESAALEELERLRGQIERQQVERRRVEEEFEQFIRSFKTPADGAYSPASSTAESRPARAEPPPGIAPQPTPSAPVASRPRQPPPPAALPPEAAAPLVAPRLGPPPAVMGSPPESQLPAAASGPESAEPGPAPAAPRGRWMTPTLVGGGLILVIAGGLFAWSVRNRAPDPTADAPAAGALPAPTAVADPPAPTAPEPPPPPTEITTIRPVWIRVLVDGQRVLEREMPAGTRVPLTPQKTIVIRTGDAGAVRLSIRGKDEGFLGREGEVITRTFTVPAATVR